jgi:mono/diheme cytochrome c family protein
MKKGVKRLVWGILIVVGLVGVILATAVLRVELRRNEKVVIEVTSTEFPQDAASLVEGKRILQTKGCADCHGDDMGGRVFVDEPPVGRFAGSNLTRGKGSRVANYKDVDWIRAIRFGVDPEGRPLIMMPAGDFHGMSNRDLGRMIAYLKTMPPVDRESEPQKIGPVSRVLYNINQMPLLFSHELLDRKAEFVDDVTVEPTAEYGKYVANACIGCHGPGFSGGPIPGTPPSWPTAKNLTPSGRFAQWSLEDFKKVLRTGLTPENYQINPQFMPWKATQAMTDIEIEALFRFLKTLPARAEGTR